MDRRIFGLENEYGVTCTLRGQRRLSPDEVARYLFRRVVSWGRSSNVFLENGSRLYLDVGSHPEYATPECDNLNDLILAGSGWTLVDAYGINEAGQIVGWGLNPDGYQRGYLLTPIPEPSAVAVLSLGVVGLLLRKLKKN